MIFMLSFHGDTITADEKYSTNFMSNKHTCSELSVWILSYLRSRNLYEDVGRSANLCCFHYQEGQPQFKYEPDLYRYLKAMGKALCDLLICLSNLSEMTCISACFYVRECNTAGFQNTKKNPQVKYLLIDSPPPAFTLKWTKPSLYSNVRIWKSTEGKK